MWGRSIGDVWVEEGRERLAGCLQRGVRGVSFLEVEKAFLLGVKKSVLLLGVEKNSPPLKANNAPPLKTKKTTLWKEKTTAHP